MIHWNIEESLYLICMKIHCNAVGVEIEENSELDLFEAFNKHAGDERIPDVVKDMEKELGEGNKKPEILEKLAQYELCLLYTSCFVLHKGEIVFACEDLGRHNALDKAVGCAVLALSLIHILFPVVDHAVLYCVALAVGSVLGAVILSLVKKTQPAEAK